MEYLSFRLGDVCYGLDILSIQEIREYKRPTRTPSRDIFRLGILDLRGTIVPIIDLRLLFGLEATYGSAVITVIAQLEGRTYGFVVDAVSKVVAVNTSEISEPPTVGGQYVSGIATITEDDSKSLMMLLDLKKLFGEG